MVVVVVVVKTDVDVDVDAGGNDFGSGGNSGIPRS